MEGYAGNALIVNLTTGEITKEPISREMASKYIGGEGFNNYYLWRFLYSKGKAGIDPLSPDNVLCASQGPLGSTLIPLGSKTKWSFKSPVYHMHGDSACGGRFTTNMRYAGYDALVILGRARKPSYLWIEDDTVEIRDASHLWGLDVWDTDSAILEELGDEKNIAVTCIGPAGENLVRFASLISNKQRGSGRTGGGCVMGSKNLKAVVARGTKGLKIARIDELMSKAEEIIDKINRSPMMPIFGDQGSLFLTKWHDAHGTSGLRNFQYQCGNTWKGTGYLEPLSGDWYMDNMWVRNLACSNSCIVHCSDWWRIKGDESPSAHRFAGECGDKPEYAYISSMGILQDNIDFPAAAHLSNLTNRYGADMFELGNFVSFLMELTQRGIVNKDDTGGINFEWGSIDAIEETIQRVVGPGDLKDKMKDPIFDLAYEGVYQAGVKLEKRKGTPTLKYLNYGKGHSPHLGDMRNGCHFATLFATSNRGTDHLKALFVPDRIDPLEAVMPVIDHYFKDDPFVREKGLDYKKAAYGQDTEMAGVTVGKWEDYIAIINCLGICTFAKGIAGVFFVTIADLAEAYTSFTGIELSEEDLWAAGRRVSSMEKAFNTLHGFTRKDDTVCHRWMNEPSKGGWMHNLYPDRYPDEAGKGMKMGDYLEDTKTEYYEYRGYDPETSLQTKKALKALGLDEIAGFLEKEGKLAEQVNKTKK